MCPNLVDAWSEYDATAPEEAELPEAVQFKDVLEAPETVEERNLLIEEYEKALPDRISDELLGDTRKDECVLTDTELLLGLWSICEILVDT